MLCIAHRGGAGLRPENTLAAFRHAVEIGCDGAELDVQLTRDGEVVVVHDFVLNRDICRNAQGRWLEQSTLPINTLTLPELREFDVGRARPESEHARKHPEAAPVDGERIPRLAEVIGIAAKTPRPFSLLVELKTSPRDCNQSTDPGQLADAALDVLHAHGFLGRTILTSFDWRGLQYAKRQATVECWFITEPQSWATAERGSSVVNAVSAAGGDGWYPMHRDLTPASVAQARELGLKVAAWTVNSAKEMGRLKALDIDAICTDRPDLLIG